MTCQYVYPAGVNETLGKCEKPKFDDSHLPEYHTGCIGVDRYGCMLHEYVPEAPPEPEVITIDLTPTWAGIILPLAEAYAVGGSTEARDELLRLARHVDNMRGKAP